jgi:hypothetical protein
MRQPSTRQPSTRQPSTRQPSTRQPSTLRPTSRRRSAVITAAGCGFAALAAGLAPSSAALAAHSARATHRPAAAPLPRWRITGVNNYGDHDTLTSVAAISPADAWAGGLAGVAGTHAFLQHWNGQTWTRTSLPAAIRKISFAQVSGLAASSASNVWAFISGHPAAVARFDGTSWSVVREWPGEAFSITGEAFGRRDVWMFGGIGPQTAGTWHYDGHAWTRPKMPLTAFDVSRVSARDEWAIGERLTRRGNYVAGVERWNGRSWAVVPTGRLIPTDTATRSTALGQILARSPRSVWVTGTVYTGGFQHLRSFVLHWNGKKWHRVTGQRDVSIGRAALGGSGLWVVTQHVRLTDPGYIDPAPGLASYGPRHRVALVTPSHPGRSLEINAIADIPGTHSAWAVGGYFTDTMAQGWVPDGGVILQHGQ